MQFFETVMGKRFYEGSVPTLIRSLEEQNKLLTEQNALLEQQLKQNASIMEDMNEKINALIETLKWLR